LVGRVDLNNIPLALVDRVDVLTGGASSTYGADAVAGVINFITRNDFAGMELAVSDQITQKGDGNSLRADLTIGANFEDGRGNATISLGYQESDPVYQGGDRPWSNLALNSVVPGTLSKAGSSVSTPTVFDFANFATQQQVGPTGDTIVPFYQPFNFSPYNLFQTPFKRYNIFSTAHYDLTDRLTVYGRAIYNNNTVDTIIAPSGAFGESVTVPLSNPFLSAAQRQTLCTDLALTAAQCTAAATATNPTDPNYRTDTFGLRRRMTELGPRISDFNSQMFDFRVGLRGDITNKIGFDLFAARGISDRTQTTLGYALISRIRQALLATNTTSCLTTTNNCVPLNVFGVSGSITPQMANFLTDASTVLNHSELSQVHGAISGDTPLQLWAKNPVTFAVGGEYRKYAARQRSDSLAKSGDLGGFGAAPADIKGGFDVYEGFAETIVPIISDRPFAQDLQFEAGIRRSHYTVGAPGSPKFDTTTWKIAGDWAPVRDVKFRANYQHAVRAPNIAELFSPVATGLTNLTIDPCAGTRPTTGSNAANLAAICLAQGAPANRIGLINNPNSGQANLTAGGSLTLKPETAKTWTIGTVLRPRLLPGFSATIDYYNIRVKDAITVPSPGDLINACFGDPLGATASASAASSPACTVIRRNPITGALDGSISTVRGLLGVTSNQGKITTDGVDLTFDYRHKLGTVLGAPAKIALSFGGNYTHSQKFKAIASSSASIDRECVGYYSVNCGFPAGGLLPKYTFNERTTLTIGRVDLSMLWRHIDKMRYEPGLPPLFSGTITSTPTTSALYNQPGTFNGETVDFNKIPAFNYFDFSSRFNINEHIDLTLTVQNLFDKKPPIVGNTAGTTSQNSGNTFPSTYDPLGRRIAAGARIKF
jgi:outer membrane receptor protein involved in Fe transport